MEDEVRVLSASVLDVRPAEWTSSHDQVASLGNHVGIRTSHDSLSQSVVIIATGKEFQTIHQKLANNWRYEVGLAES